MDDILIYSKNQEDHDKNVREVLKRLIKNKLYAKVEKCEFDCKETDYLGYKISEGQIKMAENKVDAILTWPAPKSKTELQAFSGFRNFYRRFIKGYSRIIQPLTKLLCKPPAG